MQHDISHSTACRVIVADNTIRWRHNERADVSNHRRLQCLLNCLFRRRSKETSKLCVTGRCEGNSPVTGEFPAHRACYAENVSIRWRHHKIGVWTKRKRHFPLPRCWRSQYRCITYWRRYAGHGIRTGVCVSQKFLCGFRVGGKRRKYSFRRA